MGKAYEGNEPYIFISYAHKDSKAVLSVVNALQRKGFRVWYDGGIEAGSEWPEYIAAHLKNCECVLSFISESFVKSDNCRRELIFAQEERKPMVSIYMEDVALSDGMRMQLGLNQAIHRKNFSTLTAFCEEIGRVNHMQSCRATDDLTQARSVRVCISCAQEDRSALLSLAEALRRKGYEVRTEENSEQTNVAQIEWCDCMLCVITPRYVASERCRGDMMLAQKKKKPILNIYAEDVALSDGMRMQLGLNQSVYRNNFNSEEEFCDAVCSASLLMDIGKTVLQKEKKPSAADTSRTSARKAPPEKTIAKTDVYNTDREDAPPPDEAKREKVQYKRLVWTGALLELSYSFVGPFSLELLTKQSLSWWLLALSMIVPHALIAMVIRLLFRTRGRRMKWVDASDLFVAPLFCLFLSTVFAVVFGVSHVHCVDNTLLKVLISLGLNVAPALVAFGLLISSSDVKTEAKDKGSTKQ